MSYYGQNSSDSEEDNEPLAKKKHLMEIKTRYSRSSTVSNEDDLLEEMPDLYKFWFRCHKRCRGNAKPRVKCSSCIIKFHVKCMPDMNLNEDGWQCTDCLQSRECSDDDSLRYSFIYVIERALRKSVKNGTFEVPNDYKNNPLLINPLTFDEIVERGKNRVYANVHSLLLDFKWLHHNCEILFFHGAKMYKECFEEARNTSRTLLKDVSVEIGWLEKCADCYVQNNFDILEACSKPHLIVWAQFDMYPYWPAKILNIDKETKTFEVLFFQEYNCANISCDNCYLYTDKDPNDYMTESYKGEIQIAMDEVKKYLKSVEKKFGPVQPPSTWNVKPVFEKLETEHLDDMYPGYRNPDLRVHQNEPAASVQADNEYEIPNIDDSMGNASHTCQHMHDANSNRRTCIPINKRVRSQLQLCLETLREMKAAHESQRAEILRLQQQNERQKSENDALRAENLKLRLENERLKLELALAKRK